MVSVENHRLRAVLITPNRPRIEQFHSSLAEEAGFELLCALESRPGRQRWSALVAHTSPDCILLDATDQPLALETLLHFQTIGPHCPIIVFADELSPGQAHPLLHAGAFEFFDFHTSSSQLAELRARLVHQRPAQPVPAHSSGTARVAGFAASKPGAGASTLARHTACALRRATGERVLLMDWNTEHVLAGAERHEWCGITVDPPPSAPLTPALARARLAEESSHFDWIIVDLPCAASHLTLCLAPDLPDLVLAATPDLAGIHMAKRSLELLHRAGVPPANIRLLLNRVTSQAPLTATDIGIALKHTVEWKVPDSYYRLQAASDHGIQGDSPLALALRGIATGLVDGLRTPPEPAQFFWMSRCEEVLA